MNKTTTQTKELSPAAAVTDAAVSTAAGEGLKRVKRPVELVDQEERTRMRRLKWAEKARVALSEAVSAGKEGQKHKYLKSDGTTNIDKILADFAPISYRPPAASEPLARRTRDEFVYWDMCQRGQCKYDRKTYYDTKNEKFLKMEDLPRPKSQKQEEQEHEPIAA